MNRLFSQFKLFIFLLLIWLLMSGSLEISTVLIGLLVSFVVTIFSYETLLDRKGKHLKTVSIFRLIRYFLTLFIEIFKASYLFSVNVFKKEYVPTVFKISMKHLDPVRVAIVANSITLTPGTISIEIIDQSIYVMVLAKPGTPVKDLERPIRDHFEKLLDGEAS